MKPKLFFINGYWCVTHVSTPWKQLRVAEQRLRLAAFNAANRMNNEPFAVAMRKAYYDRNEADYKARREADAAARG